MIRTITLTPPPGDWIAYQVDEGTLSGWKPVAARQYFGKDSFSTAVRFSEDTTSFRVSWVGDGGSRNMLTLPSQSLDEQARGRRRWNQ